MNYPRVKEHAGAKGNERGESLANLGRGSAGLPLRRLEHSPLVAERGNTETDTR